MMYMIGVRHMLATCATRKSPSHSPRSPLGTITDTYPTQIMLVDLVGLHMPLPESNKQNCYTMVVDNYFFCTCIKHEQLHITTE